MFESKIFIAIASLIAGSIVTTITNLWMNRRSVFTYTVSHSHIGVSADDKIYGIIKVTWNDEQITRLFLTKIEITNISSTDFENIKILAFTNNTSLLTQRTEVSETTEILHFSKDYQETIEIESGKEPTSEQYEFYRSQREYIAPIMNRGQKVIIELLNAASTEEEPEILIEILQKGIICKYQIEQPLFLGMPQYTSAYIGTAFGLLCIFVIIIQIKTIWIVAMLSYCIGLIALIPGAMLIKIYKTMREWVTG